MYNQNQPQQARSQYGKSQYNPQNLQNQSSSQFTPNNAGSSQYAQNNNYYQASALQGGGVNQYGAQYSSGNRDEDIGNAYYQSQAGTGLNQNKSQYNPQNIQSSTGPQFAASNTGSSQYARNNNYYQASALQGGGVNQYGAHYSSGKRDEDVGNAYYQSTQPVGNISNTSSQYNPQLQQSNINPTNSSQYAQKNNYYQSSFQQGTGVNQYGAHYTSGKKDEDIGNAYFNKTSQ